MPDWLVQSGNVVTNAIAVVTTIAGFTLLVLQSWKTVVETKLRRLELSKLEQEFSKEASATTGEEIETHARKLLTNLEDDDVQSVQTTKTLDSLLRRYSRCVAVACAVAGYFTIRLLFVGLDVYLVFAGFMTIAYFSLAASMERRMDQIMLFERLSWALRAIRSINIRHSTMDYMANSLSKLETHVSNIEHKAEGES